MANEYSGSRGASGRPDYKTAGLDALPAAAKTAIEDAARMFGSDPIARDLSCVEIVAQHNPAISEKKALYQCQKLFSR